MLLYRALIMSVVIKRRLYGAISRSDDAFVAERGRQLLFHHNIAALAAIILTR